MARLLSTKKKLVVAAADVDWAKLWSYWQTNASQAGPDLRITAGTDVFWQ